MKSKMFLLLAVVIAVVNALPARADDSDRGRRWHRYLQEQQQERGQQRQPQQNDDGATRAGFVDTSRMTPDERQKLRRDVREAGDDIYRHRHGADRNR